MKKLGLILVAFVIGFAGLIGKRYYDWVETSTSPFDEVGIELNRYMPAPIQAWGCNRLRERFEGKTMPPWGCQDAGNPRQWRKA
ncbi:MAG: hypothetical protein J0H01_31160 [Rhizobiales bacterium]|nr:hypothetical protein [Hyphomicrobiales bacterium]